MSKWWIYGALLAAALIMPHEDVTLGKMKPVETVSVREEEGLLVIETDTEDMGVGNTIEEALKDLKETTAGNLYLDTATYLLVDQATFELIPELATQLKGTVRICMQSGETDLKLAGEYLREHIPIMELRKWRKGIQLQVLECENGRMKLK